MGAAMPWVCAVGLPWVSPWVSGIAAMLVACLSCTMVAGHGGLAKPTSKNAFDLLTSTQLSTQDYFTRSAWFVDKAFFKPDNKATPWKKPGHFNWESARDLIDGHPQTFHPCGCISPSHPRFCAAVDLANGFGETTLGGSSAMAGPKITPPTWAKGSQQETGFNMYANHAGGYLYMLCKKTSFDKCKADHLATPLWTSTRDQLNAYLKCVWGCFETNVLEWVPDSQKIQYQEKSDMFVTTKARTKTEGVKPEGSVWREVPIPDTNQVSGGGEGVCQWEAAKSFSNDAVKAKFKADFGDKSVCDRGAAAHNPQNWHVMDMVKVPTNLPPGEYLLSWRWECYKADQLWSNCADVMIAPSGTPSTSPPPPPPSPPPPPTPPPPERNTKCFDNVGDQKDSLPSASLPDWAGGDGLDCATFQTLSRGNRDFCQHTAIKKACCFCGGGVVDGEPNTGTKPPPSAPPPAPAGCADKKLPVAWSQNGQYECAYYKGRGQAYCAHVAIKEACCFCQKLLSQLSEPLELNEIGESGEKGEESWVENFEYFQALRNSHHHGH